MFSIRMLRHFSQIVPRVCTFISAFIVIGSEGRQLLVFNVKVAGQSSVYSQR